MAELSSMAQNRVPASLSSSQLKITSFLHLGELSNSAICGLSNLWEQLDLQLVIWCNLLNQPSFWLDVNLTNAAFTSIRCHLMPFELDKNFIMLQ